MEHQKGLAVVVAGKVVVAEVTHVVVAVADQEVVVNLSEGLIIVFWSLASQVLEVGKI